MAVLYISGDKQKMLDKDVLQISETLDILVGKLYMPSNDYILRK